MYKKKKLVYTFDDVFTDPTEKLKIKVSNKRPLKEELDYDYKSSPIKKISIPLETYSEPEEIEIDLESELDIFNEFIIFPPDQDLFQS